MKKLMFLLVAVLLMVSFSACNKTDEAETDTVEMAGTVWESEEGDAVITLTFEDDKTCILTTGSISTYAAYRRNFSFEAGYAAYGLLFYEESPEGNMICSYHGTFIDRNLLRLTKVENNFFTDIVVDFKKLP